LSRYGLGVRKRRKEGGREGGLGDGGRARGWREGEEAGLSTLLPRTIITCSEAGKEK